MLIVVFVSVVHIISELDAYQEYDIAFNNVKYTVVYCWPTVVMPRCYDHDINQMKSIQLLPYSMYVTLQDILINNDDKTTNAMTFYCYVF